MFYRYKYVYLLKYKDFYRSDMFIVDKVFIVNYSCMCYIN